jgi:nucleoprotein TPR
MEKRYESIAKRYELLLESKDSLEKENTVLQTNLRDTKQDFHKLQASLMKAESDKEQLRLEVDSLERDKVSVQGAYQESKKEIMELQDKLQTVSSKVLHMTKENGRLDAKIQHMLAEKSRESINHSKIEQEKSILEKSNKWLEEELERKAQMSSDERQKATQKIIELSNQCCDYKTTLENLEKDHGRLKAEHMDQHDRLKSTSKLLKETTDSFAEKQESFEQELALAQKMAHLYRESSDEYAKRTMELEGIISELKVHLEESSAAYHQTVADLEEKCRIAIEEAQEERKIREKVVAAAAAGSFDISTRLEGVLPAEEACTHNTSAQIYAKLIEAEEKLRLEKLKTREKEIYFEDLLIEVEKRANLLQEQQSEYEKMKASHVKLLSDINKLAIEKQKIHDNMKKEEVEAKDLNSQKISLEQQVRDLGQQVAKLLHHSTSQSTNGTNNFVGGDATDVTTQYLIEFTSIQELQQQNQKLLKVNRELSLAAETTKEEAKKEMQQEYESRITRLRSDLDDVKRNREHAEEIFEHVVRQRDTLRELLHGVGGDLGAGRKLLSSDDRMNISVNDDTFTSNPENLQYREMYADLEKKFDEFKKVSAQEYSNLEKELSSAKNELISMKKLISQAQAECQYERDRSSRLSVSIDSHQKQIESLLGSNAKYQALVNEAERRLATSQQSISDSEEKLRCLNNQVLTLESQNKILTDAEKRLTEEASCLSQEKFRLAADLDVLRNQFNQLESGSSEKLSKSQGALSKLENSLSDANQELAIAKGRVKYAHAEEKIEAKTSALTEMQRRASSAEAKVDLLQEAVRISEEKVARLEIEKNARISVPLVERTTEVQSIQDNDLDNVARFNELQAEIKILREELVSSQEALAGSTGHAKQYETIAQTAEEALKCNQADFEKFKRDAANRVSSLEAEVKRLRVELSKKDLAIKELKHQESTIRLECDNLRGVIDAEKRNAKEEIHQAFQNLEKQEQRVSELTEDAQKLSKDITEIRKAYDAEVVAHGDAMRRIASTESTLEETQNRLNSVLEDLDKERASRMRAESEQKAMLHEERRKVQSLQKNLEKMSKIRDTLQLELESLAKSSGPDISNLSNSMKLLRQEREAAELNLSLCEREVVRLRQENSVAKRAVEEARAQLSAELERQSTKKSQMQESHANYIEQISITRESNIALRSDNLEKQNQIEVLNEQIRQNQAMLDPLNLKIKEKESQIANLKDEIKVAIESAQRWENRAKSLSEKAGSLNAEEYEQVKLELDEVKHDLVCHQEKYNVLLREKEELESRLKDTEIVAHRANANTNTIKKQLDEQRKKIDASNKSMSELSKKQQEEKEKKILEITQEKNALEIKVQELVKKEEVWKEKAKNLLSNCEKSNLAKKQAESQAKSLKSQLESLRNEIASLKSSSEQVTKVLNIAVSDEPEAPGKRKIEVEQQKEMAAKKPRTAPDGCLPSNIEASKHNQNVSTNMTTGKNIVDVAIRKAIGKNTESTMKVTQPDPEILDREEKPLHGTSEKGANNPEEREIERSKTISEAPQEEQAIEFKQVGGLEENLGDPEDKEDNILPLSTPGENDNPRLADESAEHQEIIEEGLNEKTRFVHEKDVHISNDEGNEDMKQADEDKPDSPKRKTKRTKIQWKDTSK